MSHSVYRTKREVAIAQAKALPSLALAQAEAALPEVAHRKVGRSMTEPRRTRCPVCRGDSRGALWWSKAGRTADLCDDHKEAARAQRRLRYESDQVQRKTFTLVRIDEPKR